ncbi:MAG: DUF2378 family protein [Archangium sp.]|nr:DUF2378 family protein [Archangium sp.]
MGTSTVDLVAALKQRLAMATQKDVIHGMFIENSITLVSQLRSPQFADEVRTKVIGGKKLVGFFRYPVVDLLKVMEIAVEGAEDPQKILEEFGANSVRIFFDSPVGRTMLLLASSDPHKLLFSAPAGFKASASFGERVYKKEAENAGTMVTTGDLLGPSWTVGVFRYALGVACNVKANVEVSHLEGPGLNYVARVSW